MKFIGREAELKAVSRSWDDVKSGKGPRFVALVSEGGFGNTAIVQEYYPRIAREENGSDGVGYWPDDLATSADDSRVAPRLTSNLPEKSASS